MHNKNFQISSVAELINICDYIKTNDFPHIFVLQGDLGAGKTTFVRTFLSRWNSEIMVSSPTFTLMNVYHFDQLTIYHFDLYRISNADEAIEFGFDEYLNECDYAFIEWAERAPELLPKPYTLIKIEDGNSEYSRNISVSIVH